jgi:acyl carrier protein
MQKQNVKDYFEQIVRESSISCAIMESIDPNADLVEDLGFDSLATIKLISDIESRFDIEFEVDELVYDVIGRYGTLLENILKKLEKKGKIDE